MPVLPDKRVLGDRFGSASQARGAPSQGATVSLYRSAARDIQSAAQSVERTGVEVEKIKQDDDKAQEYRLSREFAEFASNERTLLQQSKRGVKSNELQGFGERYRAGYTERAKQFFQNVPEELKPQYDAILFNQEDKLATDATDFEFVARDAETKAGIQETTNKLSTAVRTDPTGKKDLLRSGIAMIENSGLPEITKKSQIRALRKSLTTSEITGHLERNDIGGAREVLNNSSPIVDRIIGVESGGKATAKNPKSSATGLGQFIESTWLDVINRHFPEVKRGKTRAQILALRNNPKLSRQATAIYTAENQSSLRKAGVPVTPGTTYLAHFLGPGGAKALLRTTNKGRSVKAVLADTVGAKKAGQIVSANGSILRGKSVDQVIAWAERKMKGVGQADLSPDEQRVWHDRINSAEAGLERSVKTQQNEQRTEFYNQLLKNLDDGKASQADIDLAEQAGVLDTFERREKAEKVLNKAQEDVRARERVESALRGESVLDPNDTDDKKALNTLFNKGISGDDRDGRTALAQRDVKTANRLTALAHRVSAIPADAASALTAQLRSKDPEAQLFALQTLGKLHDANPAVFDRAFNKSDKARVTDFLRLSQFMDKDRLLETVRERDDLRNRGTLEVVDKESREATKDVTPDVIIDRLFGSTFKTDPDLVSADLGAGMVTDYQNLYRVAYRETGDHERSEEIANQQMQRLWNTSNVTGNRVVMRFPPELNYPEVGGSHEWMTEQLRSSVEQYLIEEGGLSDPSQFQDPEFRRQAERVRKGEVDDAMSSIVLVPTPQADRFTPGSQPEYFVGFRRNGVLSYAMRGDKVMAFSWDATPFRKREHRRDIERLQRLRTQQQEALGREKQLREQEFEPEPVSP